MQSQRSVEHEQLFEDAARIKIETLSSFLAFTKRFYKILHNRDFIISNPVSNEPHIITLCRAFMKVFKGETNRLMIEMPPGWSKTTLCQMFIAYCWAHYPDCRFLYVSHSYELAAEHTHTVKKIVQLGEYQALYDVHLNRNQSAKDFFQTTKGGAVAAFGAKGSIVGRDAGLPGLPRFSGALIIDDIHKPDEVHSDTIREKVHQNYFQTIQTRLRSENVPVILIGHRLHQDDLQAHLTSGKDGKKWERITIKALDDAENPRYPEIMTKETLLDLKRLQPYVFASQYQQDPIPAGGALFKEEFFQTLSQEPEILGTFITVDSAETEKTYNDATAMSFWGLYRLHHDKLPLDLYGLHWLDCREIWVEPADLEDAFLDFYASCLRHPVKPYCVAIEKKSTGTTLLSVLKKLQGIPVIDIPRTKKSGSKTDRYIAMQQYVNSRQITFPAYANHTNMCIKHMSEITANQTHGRDDICDTAYDAVDIALIRRMIINQVVNSPRNKSTAKRILAQQQKVSRAKDMLYGGHIK